mgnify:CR=1 FL=1
MKLTVMKLIVLVALGLSFSGCVEKVINVVGPNGNQAYAVTCGTTYECYETASQTCPKGYIIHNSEKANGLVGMLVECK